MADMAVYSQKHGALFPYFLLLIGRVFIINTLCLLNYLQRLAQIEAICIYKEPFIYFLHSSLFSITHVSFVTFFTFSFPSSLLFSFLWISRKDRKKGRRRKAGCTAVTSTHFGFSEVYICICFLSLGCTRISRRQVSICIMVTVKCALWLIEWSNMHKALDRVLDTERVSKVLSALTNADNYCDGC